MAKGRELDGTQWGWWTVLKRIKTYDNHARALCRCQCGIEREVLIDHLTHGRTKSCGCYKTRKRA